MSLISGISPSGYSIPVAVNTKGGIITDKQQDTFFTNFINGSSHSLPLTIGANTSLILAPITSSSGNGKKPFDVGLTPSKDLKFQLNLKLTPASGSSGSRNFNLILYQASTWSGNELDKTTSNNFGFDIAQSKVPLNQTLLTGDGFFDTHSITFDITSRFFYLQLVNKGTMVHQFVAEYGVYNTKDLQPFGGRLP